VNALLITVILVLAVVILVDSLIKWYGYLFRKRPVATTEVIVYSKEAFVPASYSELELRIQDACGRSGS